MLAVFLQWPAAANPSHPVVTQGSASFYTQGSQLTIRTGGNTLINWSGFNIGKNQTTTFVQPSASSVVWNHITDPNPTQILGHLNANGYVVLQNQSGFYIGGNAVINAAGLVMTTTPQVPPNVFGGGTWEFTAPPPTAKIINYGEINAGPEGSVFLISHDIENHGTITAPGGNVGLYAGEQVLMSPRADGKGFSSVVTLPQGSVDNSGKIIADAGTIALNAQVVNQGGLIQANSVREENGVIEIVASDSVNLGRKSTISAKGDSEGTSAGGQVTVKGGNSFSDAPGSSIDVSGGAQGGNGGQVEVSAAQINSIQSQINGRASAGFTGGALSIDPQNISLSATGSAASSGTVHQTDPPATGTLTLNPNSFNSFSQVDLQATGNITLATPWTVPSTSGTTSITLQAGKNIIFNNGDSLTVQNSASVNLIAGADFTSLTSVVSGTGTVALSGTAGVQTVNGAINLKAGLAIQTGTGAVQSTAGGAVSMQAMSGNISVASMTLNDTTTPSALTMQAGGNITVTTGLMAGNDWALNMIAGATFATPTSVNTKGTGSVTLSGNAVVQTANEDIDITAAGSVTVSGTLGTSSAIRTVNGGNINVNAVQGNVNAGANPSGYAFRTGGVSTLLGGISTAAGGNVTITAGGDVTSFLPTGTSSNPTDAGTGAFGPEPGVVTITAGGNVYGHYVAADSVANGVIVPSTITAQRGNAGSTTTVNNYLALSLITGSWVVNAPNGSINLQEARNPYGTLNGTGIGANAANNNVFNYDPNDAVTLNAGYAVNLLGTSLPRYSGQSVPCIYPPTLAINAGAGGVSLGSDVILFPSPDGELTINTTTTAPAGSPTPKTPAGTFVGNGFTLAMSDSGFTRWIAQVTDFETAHAPAPVQVNNNQPVVLNIAGDVDSLSLDTPKETQVTIGGNMNNVSYTGQNLHKGDTSFFHVTGSIVNQNSYAFVPLTKPLPLPPALFSGSPRNYLQLLFNAVVPGSGPSSPNSGALFPSLDLFYVPSTKQLGYAGVMDPGTEALLLGTLQEKTFTPGGKPVLDSHGNYVTVPATFAANSGSTQPLYQAIQSLATASQSSISLSAAAQGLVIGGPGALDITAQTLNLGAASQGISSVGPKLNPGLVKISNQGAAININLTGDLDIFASLIDSLYGGAIDIKIGGDLNAGLGNLPLQQPFVPHGIWTSAKSDISVIANGNINIDGSRIAAFDGGNVFVESLTGDVNAGTGSLSEILVDEVRVNPKTGVVSTPQQPIAGSGILATTLPDAKPSLQVGNITVDAPQGNIIAGLGGITQEPENGNSSLTPTVTLNAGTINPQTGQVIHVGNIDAGNAGVIAVNVNAQASGKINGLFISSGNSTIHADSINVTALAGGTASLSANSTITGTVIAGGGISIGSGSFAGVALSQNVSGGGAQSALASAASASAGSQNAAAQEANSQKSETSDQATTAAMDEDLKRARSRTLLAKYTGRVTVLLPPKQ